MKVHVNPEQFNEALKIIQRSRGLVKGPNARKVFKAVGIRSWPMVEQPVSSGRDYGIESTGEVYDNEILNTAQDYLHGPTVRKYIKNTPKSNPDYPEGQYLPEVYTTVRGSKWIDEGHHRIVASRLRGDGKTEVYEGYVI